jgi:hypothetical protein
VNFVFPFLNLDSECSSIGDGDIDCLVGYFEGNVVVFLNEGTADAPAFTVTVSDLLGSGDDDNLRHASPFVRDFDFDGKRSLNWHFLFLLGLALPFLFSQVCRFHLYLVLFFSFRVSGTSFM